MKNFMTKLSSITIFLLALINIPSIYGGFFKKAKKILTQRYLNVQNDLPDTVSIYTVKKVKNKWVLDKKYCVINKSSPHRFTGTGEKYVIVKDNMALLKQNVTIPKMFDWKALSPISVNSLRDDNISRVTFNIHCTSSGGRIDILSDKSHTPYFSVK